MHVLHRCTDGFGAVGENLHFHGLRQRLLQCRQQCLHAIRGFDDIRTRLTLNVEDDRRLRSNPRGEADVLDVVHDITQIAQTDRRAIAIGNYYRAIFLSGLNLIIRPYRIRLPRAVEAAFRRVDVVLHQRSTDIFQAQPERCDGRWIDAYTDRRLLISLDGYQPHPGHLAKLLGQHRVGEIVHLFQREGIRR